MKNYLTRYNMNSNNRIFRHVIAAAAVLLFTAGCTRDIDTSVPAAYPDIPEVFIDGFSSDLQYQAWGKVTNFTVDYDEKYSGSASMRIEVPRPSDPLGNWAGGTFYSSTGRDLTGYDALTFYVKATVATEMEVGIGNYGDVEYLAQISGVRVNSNWEKVIVPIPNPAKLECEQGLFYYSAGAVDDEGYTVWIDEVRFEKLGTLAHTRIADVTMSGFPTGDIEISELTAYVNLPNGTDQEMTVSSKYFTFESSAPGVATVEDNIITFHGERGKAVLSPKEAAGSITITGIYDFAPVPQHDESNVVSLYCDNYTNTLSSPFNGYWAPYQTTTNNEIDLGDNHIMHYGSFNFVGIVLDEDLDCTGLDYVHLDVLLQDSVEGVPQLDVSADINADGEAAGRVTVPLETGEWVPVDVPLNGAAVIHQLQLAITANTVTYQNILVDNIYFY